MVLLRLVASFSPITVTTGASQLTRFPPVAKTSAFLICVSLASATIELMEPGVMASLKALRVGAHDRAFQSKATVEVKLNERCRTIGDSKGLEFVSCRVTIVACTF